MSSPLVECSPLALVDHAVQRVSQPPSRFAVDAAQLGIHHGPTTLSMLQLRQVLAAPDTPLAVKNRAWAQLITRAQHHDPSERQGWTLIAIGVALPGLRAVASELAQGHRGSRAELETEILAGFLTALTTAHTASQQRFPVLLRAAHRSGLAWLAHCRLAPPPIADTASDTATGTGAATPGATPVGVVAAHSGGHPDDVLADAVRAGIITSGEADLIAATRLERRPLRLVAAQLGVTANTVWMRRHRAEKRLIAALIHAIAAEDSDRAEDPTYAHLLATTSLIPRLARPDPTATGSGSPTPRRPRAGRPTPRIRTGGAETDTTSPLATTDAATVVVESGGERIAPVPGRRPPTSPVPRRTEHARPAPSQPDERPPTTHNLRGHNLGGHDLGGHGQSEPGHHVARPTDSGHPLSGHHDRGHPQAGRSARGHGGGHSPTSGTPPASRPRPPLLPVLVLLLMLLVGGWATQRPSHPRPGAETPASDLTALTAALTAAQTSAAITTAAEGTSLPAPLLLAGSTPTTPAPAQAGPGGTSGASGTDGTAQLTRVLTNIRSWLMGLLITLATLCLTIGGVRYLLAGGDPGEVEAAKRAVKSAAIGYALAVLAPALVAILRNLVGV